VKQDTFTQYNWSSTLQFRSVYPFTSICNYAPLFAVEKSQISAQ